MLLEEKFANMPIEELEGYCKETQKKLDKARWVLRNRKKQFDLKKPIGENKIS